MRRTAIVAALVAALIAAALPASAAIHEITGSTCNGKGGVEAPGQEKEGSKSFLRALQATGVIASIDGSVPNQVTITFDLSKPNSKFKSAGVDFIIPDGAGPGVTLILSPGPIPDPDFPAHAKCKKFA